MNKTIIALALATSMSAQAEITDISNSEYSQSCSNAVGYSRTFSPETELTEVLNAQWEILSSERISDMEKLVHLTVFMMYQRAAYNWSEVEEKHGDVDGWDNMLFGICIEALEKWKVVEKNPRGSTTAPVESIY